MGIESLQKFIETNCPSACVPIDLVKIARTFAFSTLAHRGGSDFRFQYDYEYFYPSPFCLVIDGECCLDRLYGGFFGDWVCGGQWNRMLDFLTTFFQTIQSSNVEVTVFLNGAAEPHRIDSWIENQKNEKEKIIQVLRHVSVKGTPPPKVWWIPPVGLRSALRMVLRHLNINVVLTTTDHHHEVMAYCRKNNFHGLLAEDSEYIIFDPPRYFSSEQLKLTFKGGLETKEYILNEVTRCLNLHPSRICIVAALLGNHILSDFDLSAFHKKLCSSVKGNKIPSNSLITAVVDFVRNLQSVDDLDVVGDLVFGSCPEKIDKLKQCVQYYIKGNKNNFMRYRTPGQGVNQQSGGLLPHLPAISPQQKEPQKLGAQSDVSNRDLGKEASGGGDNLYDSVKKENKDAPEGSKFASETAESEFSSRQAYQEVVGRSRYGPKGLQILTKPSRQGDSQCDDYNLGSGDCGAFPNHNKDGQDSDCNDNLDHDNLDSKGRKLDKVGQAKITQDVPSLPKVSTEVMRTARERHQRGLMSPWIFQVLSQGEIKIPLLFEDEITRELPSPVQLYRPLRQMVYAILFNLHHLQYLAEQKTEKDGKEGDKVPDIIIKEWVWTKNNRYNKPDLVSAVHLGWTVPTVTRLWFGDGPDDNKRRFQAFLTCMRSNSPLMRNMSYVSQHLLILCCVLRYIMTNPDMPVLRKQELDAFLVQSVDTHMNDVEHVQKMELPLVTQRGVLLAALFMEGVECALFANDACGAPIPWLMCCPWLFFDGKLFHRKLLKANGAKNLIDLCDNQIDQVAKVERMRTAILEGLHVQFAHPPLLPLAGQRPPPPPPPPFQNFSAPPVSIPGLAACNRGRGGHQRVMPRGGQLEVAGVVVGCWGPNYGQGPRSPTRTIPPQVVSVGGVHSRPPPGALGGSVGRGSGVHNSSTSIGHKPGISSPVFSPASMNKKKKPKKRFEKPCQEENSSDIPYMRNLGRGCTVESNSRTIQGNQLISLGRGIISHPEIGNCHTRDQFGSAEAGNIVSKNSSVLLHSQEDSCDHVP